MVHPGNSRNKISIFLVFDVELSLLLLDVDGRCEVHSRRTVADDEHQPAARQR